LRTAAKCGLLLLALVGPASSLAAPSIFCCNNEAGRQVCGDVLPSACYGRAYRELGYTGRTARTVEAPLTGEQRVQRAAEEQRRSEQERLLNEQRRKDQRSSIPMVVRRISRSCVAVPSVILLRQSRRLKRELPKSVDSARNLRMRRSFTRSDSYGRCGKRLARCRSGDQGPGVGDRVQEERSGGHSTEVRRGFASLCRAVETATRAALRMTL
jgi:hypothetical protein